MIIAREQVLLPDQNSLDLRSSLISSITPKLTRSKAGSLEVTARKELIMDGGPFDDPIFSDFGGRGGTGVHSIQVMLGLHVGHHGSDLMPTGGHLHKLDSSNSPPPHHQASHHHLQQQQQQQQQKELKELELAGMYAPLPQTQDVTTSTSSAATPTSTTLQQGLQLGNPLKRKPEDPMTLAPGS